MRMTSGSPAPGGGCDYKNGTLPPCAPLAAGYVPMQEKNPETYDKEKALARGTLFPGLDLPFKNVTNKSNPYAGTPLGELMALQFMMKEMQLFLDTHPDDTVVFSALQNVIELYETGARTYARLYGPLSLKDMQYADKYTWTNDPWPWEYREKEGQN